MVYPTMKGDPNERSFVVFEQRVSGTTKYHTRIGTVRATDQVLADTKARRLFHDKVWTKEEVYGDA